MRTAEKKSQLNAPLYQQVAAEFRRRLETAVWVPGARIPSIDALQEEFSVAGVTIRQAIESLESEGLLKRYQGKGTFVSGDVQARRWLKVATTWRSQLETIKDVVPNFIETSDPPKSPRLASTEGRPAADYIYLKSVQSRDGSPYALVSLHLAKSIFDQDPKAFRSRAAMAALVEMPGVSIKRTRQTIIIGKADAATAVRLGLALDAPVVEARWIITDQDDVAIYVAEIVYRGDLIRFEIELPAPDDDLDLRRAGTSRRSGSKNSGRRRA
ncbi:GntR family transcriptional regulator [Bradyrhizobium sp. NP1]|uniref:GntR family transcriptional regulator n=1 Tax=Bradyrhizobium sp. NP1 TaxID=3049772 RepID=UPI0025A5D60E|nr:GntR family transcriptional regulator [Bradyrhizobium sp. NP1]WJR76716.1 GntR family transcriptional regulator [Bradyrhizobium sp. NP1]